MQQLLLIETVVTEIFKSQIQQFFTRSRLKNCQYAFRINLPKHRWIQV